MKIRNCLSVCLCFFLTTVSASERYANPALNPVHFMKPVSEQKVTLLKDGKINFAIVCDLSAETGKTAQNNFVLSSRKSVTAALEGIQHAFQSVCGQKAKVLKPGSPELEKYPFLIVLGENSFSKQLGLDVSKMEPDEFRIFTFDKGIVIAGFDGSTQHSYNALDHVRFRINGTAYGAYDFCERFLGMRYYYPRIGIYAPKMKNLTIQPVNYSDKPFIKYHFSYALNSRNVPGKQQLSDFSPAWRNGSCSRYACGHTPEPRLLAKKYPDKLDLLFYRNRAGKLFYNPLAHIGNYYDVTNPAFIDFFVEELVTKFYSGDPEVRKVFGSQVPNSEYVPFGQADTYVASLLNERSKPYLMESTKNLRHGSLSDLYAHFNIELAKKIGEKFPGKSLATSVYHSRTLPPAGKYEWPDNLWLKICMGCPVMAKSPAFQKAWRSVFDDWYRTLGRPSGCYCYGVGTYPITFALQGRYMGDFIRALGPGLWRDHLMFDAAGHNHHFYYSYYPAYRSMWNPEFNVQAALDEHWTLLYGPEAGKYLKEFYDLMVKCWEQKVIPQMKEISVDFSIRGSLTPRQLYQGFDLKTLETMQQLLKKAESSVTPGSIEAQRLEFFMQPWKSQFQTALAYHKTSTPIYKIVRLNPGEKITLDGKAEEPVWRRAAVCSMKDACGESRIFPEQPQAKMAWNDQGIYLFFTAKGKPVRNRGEIWKFSDALEFFLSPGIRKQKFYQFAFDPDADLYQGMRDLVEEVGGEMKCQGIHLKSVYDDQGWSAELFVPFRGIEQKTPAPYDVWFGNIVYAQRRFESSAKNVSASFAFTMRNTHNTDLWGQFKFMGWGD